MAATAQATIPPANENGSAVRLLLSVTDPEVAHELAQHEEGDARDSFAKQALRIGILAMRQASGALDADSIQREADRMLGAVRDALQAHACETTASMTGLLKGYFDPQTGTLPERIDRLTKRDGEIDHMLTRHLDGDRSTLAQTLARQVGHESAIFKMLSPTQADGLVASLSKGIDVALRAQQEVVLREFSRDRPDSALSRLVGDVEDANGKLARQLTDAVGTFAETNARFQADVRSTLQTFRVRREEAARSSLHGHSFEYAAGELLQLQAQQDGDVCERLSGTPGREGRKTGDFVLTLGPESAAPGKRIVVECKAEKGYTESAALEELALARKNREAAIGIFVVARESALESFGGLRRIGCDILVIWDAEDPATDVNVKAAISIARAVIVEHHRSSDQTAAGLREVEDSIRAIERLVTAVESIAHDARNIVKKGVRIGKGAETVRERLGEEVERLKGVVEREVSASVPDHRGQGG